MLDEIWICVFFFSFGSLFDFVVFIFSAFRSRSSGFPFVCFFVTGGSCKLDLGCSVNAVHEE